MTIEDTKTITLNPSEGLSDTWKWNVSTTLDAGIYDVKLVSEDDIYETTIEIVNTPSTSVFTFEDQDLTKWSNLNSTAEIVSSPVNKGRYAFEVGGGNHYTSFPGGGLNYYPNPDGTRFYYAQYNKDPGDQRFGWGYDGSSGLYIAQRPGNNRYELNYEGYSLDTDSTSPPTGEWTLTEVLWKADGYVEVEVRDLNGNILASLSANSPNTNSDGGVYVRGRSTGSGSIVYFDGLTASQVELFN